MSSAAFLVLGKLRWALVAAVVFQVLVMLQARLA